MTNMRRLLDLKQSVWLDYLSRGMTRSGELHAMIADGLRGIALLQVLRRGLKLRHLPLACRRRRLSPQRSDLDQNEDCVTGQAPRHGQIIQE